MEQAYYTTECIQPKPPISQVHIHRKSRQHGPPSSFANTRWGREEIAGRHIYLADGTYVRRPKRRRTPAPQAFPNITVQESSNITDQRSVSLSYSMDLPQEKSLKRPKSLKFNAAHIFSWPKPHPLKSSPTPHSQSFAIQAGDVTIPAPMPDDAQESSGDAPYRTIVREPPRVPTLRHERRPLTEAVLNRRSFDNDSSISSSRSSSSSMRARSSLGTRSVSSYKPWPPSPAISPTSLDQENIPPATVSPDLRCATAAAIRRTDEQTQIRFSPPPSLPVFGSVGSRSRKRRHHSSSSSSSGAWPASASSAAASSSNLTSSSRKGGLVLWLGVLFGRHRGRSRHQSDASGADGRAEPRRHRPRRKRRKDVDYDDCDAADC